MPIDLHEIDPAIPSYVADPIKKALAKRPEDRQESMHDFRRELRAAERRFFIENPDWEQEIEQRERERQRKAAAEAHASQGTRSTPVSTLEMHRPPIKVPTPLTISAPAGKRYGRGIPDDTVPFQAVQRLRIGLFMRMMHAAQDFWSVTSPRARATGLGIAIGIAFTAVLLIRNDVFNPAARALLRVVPARERSSGDSQARAMAEPIGGGDLMPRSPAEVERPAAPIVSSEPATPVAGAGSAAAPEASSPATSRPPTRAAVANPRRKKTDAPSSEDPMFDWASSSGPKSRPTRPIESIPVPF